MIRSKIDRVGLSDYRLEIHEDRLIEELVCENLDMVMTLLERLRHRR